MPFGSLFNSESETSNPVSTAAPSGGASSEGNPGALVLNISDQRTLNAGHDVGKKQFSGDQTFNVTSIVEATDHGALALANARSEEAAELARFATQTVRDSGEDFANALSDTASLFATESGRTSRAALEQVASTSRLSTSEIRRIAEGALSSNRFAVEELGRTNERALGQVGDTTDQALRTVGTVVEDSMEILRSSTAEALGQLTGVAGRIGQATQGELADSIKALAWPVGLSVAALAASRFLR